jgi:Fe-S oxidoreductase/nitrate reductase gamma subunit
LPLSELFWAGQEVYLTKVFMPIIIGMAIFLPVIIVLFLLGFWRRYRLWKLGQPEKRAEKWPTRLMTTLAVALANIRIIRVRELYPGLMHLLIFGGTALLLLGKITRLFSLGRLATPPQNIFLYASLVSEIGAVLILIGGGMAVYRRYIRKPDRLDTKPEDTLVFVWAFLLILTGFMVKGFRIAISDVNPTDWAAWSPVGYLMSHAFPTFATDVKNEILVWHRALIHALPAFIFLGYIWTIRSRLQHMLLSPLNIFFRSLKSKGVLKHIDLEAVEVFGAAKIEDFTWKQLLDLDACTRCGRCQDHCPAYLTEKPLSPKKVINDLKDHMHARAPQVIKAKAKGADAEEVPPLTGSVIEEDELWTCTTCRSCMEHCPVFIEHVDTIVDMRRCQVLMESKFPQELTQVFRGLETNSNPWGMGRDLRADWIKELEVPLVSEIGGKDIDYLFFVGCIRSLDDRNKKVSEAFAKILNHIGVKFAILGIEEGCCGDPARRVGNEYLYQILAQTNIEVFDRYKIKRILTTCPHCYNTLKNEYPQLGFSCEVIHHAEFLKESIRNKRLKLDHALDKKTTYHDPCYLGRYSGMYESPRQVLGSIPSLDIREMKRSKVDSLCCGGGGGWMWMEETIGKRVNIERLEDALTVQPEWIATACPFCVTLFDDAIKNKDLDGKLKIWDIAELVEQSIFGEKK